MTINSKQKGARGERAWAKFCRENGYQDARRGVQYSGLGADDVIGLPFIHQEVKYVERLNIRDAMSQSVSDSNSDNIPIVAHKKNHCEWLVTMRAEDWFNLYREWEASKTIEKDKD